MKQKKEEKPDFSYESNLLFSQKLYRKLPYKWLRTLIMIITNILVWALAGICVMFILIPIVAMFFFNTPLMIFLSSVALVTAVLVPVIRTFSKRKKLLSALNKLCKPPYSEVRFITKPYSTVFKTSHKTDMIIETDDSVFEIMFLPSLFPRLNILISSDGKSAFRLFPVFLGKIGMLCGFKPRRVRIDISFESQNDVFREKTTRKIILLNPVPRDIFKSDEKSKSIVFGGPGEKFADYTIENIASLTRLIEHETEY